MKPLIGVTVSRKSGWRIFPLMKLSIWLAGGRATKWVSTADVDLDAVDGVVIGGGDDIGPELYGGELRITARLDPDRDAMERDVVARALDCDTPILGVCRGSQMINVVLGGSLDQDAYVTWKSRKYTTILPRKEVSVFAGTRLCTVTGPEPMKVNALHSQAVSALGEGLQVAARDEGGMVQAIEKGSGLFVLGVQWHPEHLFYARRQRSIFAALVQAAIKYRNGRG